MDGWVVRVLQATAVCMWGSWVPPAFETVTLEVVCGTIIAVGFVFYSGSQQIAVVAM